MHPFMRVPPLGPDYPQIAWVTRLHHMNWDGGQADIHSIAASHLFFMNLAYFFFVVGSVQIVD